MKISIQVDVDDYVSILEARRFLASLPGWTQDEPGDENPAPLATASEAQAVEALQAFVKTAGVPAALAILQEFGVARVTELKPEQRAVFVAKVTV